MRRNGTRPKADKPKDHEPEVQATAIRSVLPRFRAQGPVRNCICPATWARDSVWICLTRILALRHADPPFQAAKSYLERKSPDRPAPRTRAGGLTTEQGLFKREGPANGASSARKCFARDNRQAAAASNCQFLGRMTASMA